jgi:hypothetical protein
MVCPLKVSVRACGIWNCWLCPLRLERAHKRAGRFVMNNYSFEEGSMTSIMNELGWKQLKQRRQEISSLIFVPKSLVYLYHFAISYSLRWNQLLCNRHNHQQTNVYLNLCYQVYHLCVGWIVLGPNCLHLEKVQKRAGRFVRNNY